MRNGAGVYQKDFTWTKSRLLARAGRISVQLEASGSYQSSSSHCRIGPIGYREYVNDRVKLPNPFPETLEYAALPFEFLIKSSAFGLTSRSNRGKE